MSDHDPEIRQLQDVLLQGIGLIESLDDETYAHANEPLASAGVGAHVRHVLDFLETFLAGLPAGRLDYDARGRDGRVEVDRELAVARLRDVSTRLAALRRADRGARLQVRLDVPRETPERAGWTMSTVGRELQFLLSHTVHHYALIGLLARHGGIDPGAAFGVAPSTLSHWQEAGARVPPANPLAESTS